MKRALICAALLPSYAIANESLPLEHVLVSVPIHKTQAETALPVTVLTGEQLQRQAAATIGETLGTMPGIASASFGPGVGRPVIRGQQGPRSVTLQNNTLSADVSSLSPDHSVTVEALLADSIEVIRGPASLLYGGGAIGGVVNVIDNRIPRSAIDGTEGALEYRRDTASDMDVGTFRVEAGNGESVVYVSGTARDFNDLEVPGNPNIEEEMHSEGEDHDHEDEIEVDGRIPNTAGDASMFTIGASHHLGDDGFAGFSVSHLESVYGIPAGSHEHHDEHDHEHEDHDHDDHEGEDHGGEEEGEEEEFISLDVEQTRYDLQFHLHDPMKGFEALRTFVTFTDYQHVELEGTEQGTLFDRETWETRVELVHKPLLGAHGVIGMQWRVDDFSATGEEAFVPATSSDELGLFIVEDFHLDNWTFETGLRADWAERDPTTDQAGSESFFNLSVSGSALWQVSDEWTAGLALSRAARAPTTEELFANVDATTDEGLVTHAATGLIEVGDTNLDEEVSLNADFTLQWQSDRSWASLAVFYNQFSDYIFLLNTGNEVDETAVYQYTQDDAVFYGVEFDSDFRIVSSGAGNLSFGVFGDMVTGEFDDDGDVPRLPPERIGARLNWQANSWGAWMTGLYAGEQDNPGDFETETDSYTRLDIGADYRIAMKNDREFMLFAKWKNITDEEIRLSTSFLRDVAPEAGESIELGVRFTF